MSTPSPHITPKTSIAPMLSVRRGAHAIEFYQSAFGAEFWVADESPEHLNFSPETLGGGTVRMIVVVADPDAAFNQAVAAGAKIIHPVAEQYGWRIGRILDPFGHHWEIGKPLQTRQRLSSDANIFS